MAIRAITYLLFAMLLFAIQDALFKQLTHDYAVIQLLLIRMSLVVGTFFTLYVVRRFFCHESISLKTSQLPLMVGRGVAAFTAFSLYYFTLQRAGLAESATVLMSAPLFVTALSVPLLKEQVGKHRWSAVFIGFSAVVVMLRPGTALFQPIMLLPLASALIYSLLPIITRLFRDDVTTFTITLYTTSTYWACCVIASVLVNLFPATPTSGPIHQAIATPWETLSLKAYIIVTCSAALFVVGIYLVTQAYRQAQASAIASFEYLYLVWAVIIGYLMFDDVPSLLTCLAAVVISGSGVYITWREYQANIKPPVVPAVRT